MSIFDAERKVKQKERIKKKVKKKLKIKIKKDFIQAPLLVAIIIALIGITSAGAGVFLYKEQKTLSFTANISDVIYETVYEKKFEAEKLGQELDLSKFREEQAEQKAEEESTKRVEAETAQKEAEQIAREEAAKRAEEEAKRAKEELERKIAEQKLSEKEAEEQRLNADSDRDGLTLREEERLGTSDLNKDSDDDGIPDGEDTNPTGGGEDKAQYFEWKYKGTTWKWTYSIHEDWYNYYNNKPRSSHGLEYITADDPFIKEIAKALKETAEKEDYHLTSFIVSFVQGLPYVADFYTNVADRPKYPVETFIDRNGDCEDFSYLSASLVEATGIGVALVEFDDHMAVGIKTVPKQSGWYYEMDDGRYYYFETTAENYTLGEIPEGYDYKRAKIIRTWGGEIVQAYPQYKKPCYASPDFSGYYYDGSNYYSDSRCNNLAYCLPYDEFYVKPKELNFYWDSSCSQIVVKGCYKSTDYPGYFYDSLGFYYDSRCTQEARICRPSSIYSDRYWDGDNSYWDSNCTMRVVPGCSKSSLHPGFFFSGIYWYVDYQCTQRAYLE